MAALCFSGGAGAFGLCKVVPGSAAAAGRPVVDTLSLPLPRVYLAYRGAINTCIVLMYLYRYLYIT